MILRTYVYRGITYYTEQSVRDAIAKYDHILFGPQPDEEDKRVEFWKTYNVEYNYYPDAIPVSDIDKFNKLNELETLYNNFVNSTQIHITCSSSFRFNANYQALCNIDIAIALNETHYRDYDNIERILTIDELKNLQIEIKKYLYNVLVQKWKYLDFINNVRSRIELENLNIKFI